MKEIFHDDPADSDVRESDQRNYAGGGNAEIKTGFAARIRAPFKRLIESVKADFRLRTAEAELFRMSDRELADVGLSRSDIPFAVRRGAEMVAGEAPAIGCATASAQAANENLRHIAA
jgi:uncharacterized protein YjiS (DUF1127 family)